MHTFSPAKMWIAGLQALRKPFLHLHTQYGRDLPWADIDMDFMNLNQSAHGDREFALHRARLRIAPQDGRRPLAGPAVEARIGAVDARGRRLARGRTLRIARFGDNMREVAVTEGDKVEAQARLGFSVNGYGVERAARRRGRRRRDVDRLVARYDDALRRRAGAAARRRPAGDAARRRRASSSACAPSSRTGGFGAFTDTFEDLGGLEQLPGIGAQRLMADGYGFGGEGDWKTAALVRIVKVMGDGLAGGTSFMEDYTYDFGAGRPRCSGAHMLEVCPTIAAGTPTLRDPPAVDRRQGATRSGSCSTPRPGPAVVVGLVDMGDRLRLVANEVDAVDARRAAAEAARRPRGLAAATGPHDRRGVLADRRRPAPHGATTAARSG